MLPYRKKRIAKLTLNRSQLFQKAMNLRRRFVKILKLLLIVKVSHNYRLPLFLDQKI